MSGETLLPPLFKWRKSSNWIWVRYAIKTVLTPGFILCVRLLVADTCPKGHLPSSPDYQIVECIKSNYKYYCISFPILVSEVKFLSSWFKEVNPMLVFKDALIFVSIWV